MTKGKILFYDDDAVIISQFTELMNDTSFEIISFTDLDVLRKAIADTPILNDVKVLIFDLARNKQEGGLTKDFEILHDINEKFHQFRIPIFIHSAFANDIEDFKNSGTVWKIEKSGDSIEYIVNTIAKLDESGFLEAFTPGGIIERNLFEELHKSFTEQFRAGEIEKIIDSVKDNSPDGYKERMIGIFRRIAVKSLNSSLLAPIAANLDTLNPIEHFYRRTNLTIMWTGDIWTKKDQSQSIFILTPRCDLSNNKSLEIICCSVKKSDLTLNGNKEKRLKDLNNHLTDNLLGKSTRYIPKTPFFSDGGFIDLSSHKTITKVSLLEEYNYHITLSDDFTNEIVGKFASYFLRTGLPTISVSEFDSYIKLLAETNASE